MDETNHLENLSFEVVIPSCILLCPRLDSSHIRLFSLIKGLTRAHGYCYASNAYLSKLCQVTPRHITNLISDLVKEGFLEIETDKTGIYWQRKIYLGAGLNKVLRREMNCRPPRNELPTPTQRSSNNLKIVNKKIVKEREGERASAQTPPSVQISKEKRERLNELYSEEVVDLYINKLELYAEKKPKKFKEYASHSAVIESWMIRDGVRKVPPKLKQDKKDECCEDKSLTAFIASNFEHLIKEDKIHILEDGIDCRAFKGHPESFHREKEKGYREGLLGEFKRRGWI